MTMTTDRELISCATAHRRDHTDEHPTPSKPEAVAGLHPRLVLDPALGYDLALEFWLALVLREGAVASAAPFYEVAGERIVGPWVDGEPADLAAGHTPGYGQLRGHHVFPDIAGVADVQVGLLIQGAGAYSVGHLSAIAGDPRDRAADAAWRAVVEAERAAALAGAGDPDTVYLTVSADRSRATVR